MSDKYVIVTGVSSGIGLGTAKSFLRRGYSVLGSVRKKSDGDALKKSLGDNFHPLIFDVTDTQSIKAAEREARTVLAGASLVGLINNAGVATSGAVLLQSLEELRYQLEVNVIGQVAVTKAFFPLLTNKHSQGKPGKIVMISSAGGKISAPFLGSYSASKRALEGLSDSLRRELKIFGIDVIVIGPGSVSSDIWKKKSATDLGPAEGTPYEDAARTMQRYALEKGTAGETIDSFGSQVVDVFEKRSPRARYALVKGKLQNWVIPRLLPPRLLDQAMAKKFNLKRNEDAPIETAVKE